MNCAFVTYSIFFASSVAIGLTVDTWLPQYRPYFIDEDSLIENLSALFFLLSSILAASFIRKQEENKRVLRFVAALGLLGFMDEISFGRRLFTFPLPSIAGKRIDGVHDLFEVMYLLVSENLTFLSRPYVYLPIGILLLIVACAITVAACRQWTKVTETKIRLLGPPHYIFLLLVPVLGLGALFLDLDLVDSERMLVFEELFEMNATVALCFFSLSLRSPDAV